MSYQDYAYRVVMSNGDCPPDDLSNLLSSNWVSSNPPSHEAVVYNSMVHANGLYPGIPSYITWMTHRSAVSQLKLIVKGSYRRILLKLVGLEASFPNALNGWLDASQLYDGYGTPGTGDKSIGCAIGTAATRSSGTYVCTFGPQSSSFAKNYGILIRVRLENADILTSLAVEGMVPNPDIVW